MTNTVKPPMVEIAIGELIDKITILQIKSENISDPEKLKNIRFEITVLEQARKECVPASPELAALEAELKAVNKQIWDIEDAVRDCERNGRFDEHFVALARSVYKTNDKRAAVKKKINELFNSRIVEEKSYAAY
ncbi:DUF6165 family protein [Azospirillum thermophilum]|uniref:Uncharacterized protein n=1 Tax=Azospirillum thermophilum TaxID=2202148 RepID=A0A2S2D0K5_9PROT|nr:DUF6165 family protein [Azospirillum thermophilum]AWK90190.1 hypothetical protein DEW08_29700 [Azospirillum thermophilum]